MSVPNLLVPRFTGSNARASRAQNIIEGAKRATMTTPPTITAGVANAATAIAGSALVAWTDTRFRRLGAKFTAAGAYGAASIQATYQADVPMHAWEFETDADQFEVLTTYFSGSSALYRVIVDGNTAMAMTSVGATVNAAYLNLINFGSAAVRRIRIEFTGNAGGNAGFGGIRLLPTRTIWAPTRPKGPRVIALGDSYTASLGDASNAAYTGLLGVLAAQFGWSDIWATGLGGTGYVQVNGSYPNYPNRVASDMLANNPDIGILMGGINDYTFSGATVQAACATTLATMLASLPASAILVVGAPIMNSRAAGGATISTALGAACAAAGVKYIDPTGWFTGTANVGAPNGTGNQDFYLGTDGLHPNVAGADYLARRMAAGIVAAGVDFG